MADKKKRDSTVLQQLKVEHVLIGELKPNSWNPNRQTAHEFDMLKASIREDGFTQPVLAMGDSTIVDGEHRWKAARELGMTRVPVVRVSMTEAQQRIATMRHNRARGDDDPTVVAELMQDLEKLGALDWAQEALQLSDEEVRRLVAMADTVAEDLSRGHEFNVGWEPVERSTYQPPEKAGMPVSYSRPVTSISEHSNTQGDAAAPTEEAVPGDSTPDATPEPMTRRQYVFTVSEAEVVDRVLGEQAASRLYNLCVEVEQRDE